MKSKANIKSAMLTDAQDQLKDREEVANIIHEELINQLEGGSFWSELKEIIAQGKPSFQIHARWSDSKGKKKGKAAVLQPDEFVTEYEDVAKAVKEHAHEEAHEGPEEHTKAKAKAKGRKSNKVKERGQMVKKIMAERGVSLAEASRIIKQEGLL